MKIVVITGSTRGIGYGLADALLNEGCAVSISGRTEPAVGEAVSTLRKKHGEERVIGFACDVTVYPQVQSLWEKTRAHFGKIDIWINNAGLGHPPAKFWLLSPALIKDLVNTNLIGAMYGSGVAIQGMLEQGYGSLYNMEGRGSDGSRTAGLALYGSTKYGLRYLIESLIQETKGTPIIIGALSPGMVVTDLLTGQFEDRPEAWERAKRIFNILADPVDAVAPWLAGKILSNRKSGVRFAWLTRSRIIWRFITAPFTHRDLFPRVDSPEGRGSIKS
jgi:NAD(P)-dependent dehydrogenase (short-subunit alcohol dehydrogenase family)